MMSMRVEYIGRFQLFSLIVLQQIGSTTLFARGIEAKQDAWIAVLLGMMMGFIMMWVYTGIQIGYPDKNFPEILIAVLGKWIAKPLILLYALHFLISSTFNLREFSELITITILPKTPISVLIVIVMLTAVYAIASGIEVFARTAEFSLPIFLVFLVLIYILTFASGIVDFSRLKPVLENGWKPVFQAAFPGIVDFPSGEAAVFLMYWNFVKNKDSIRKVAFTAMGISGLFVVISVIIMISVLGVRITSGLWIPLFEVIKLIYVGDFVTNLDSIGVIFMLLGGFFKMTLYLYGGVMCLQFLFKQKYQIWTILLSSIFTAAFSIFYFPNLSFHRRVGLNFHTPYIITTYMIIIPLLLFLIMKVKLSNHLNKTREL
jgi:spore germination protein KB